MKKKSFFAVFFMLTVMGLAFTQEAKNALLIANGNYGRDMGALPQPVPEAKALAKALGSIGFQVTLVENASLEKMHKELKAFKTKTQKDGGIAFFHYGGHAVQVSGQNFLIPLNASLDDEEAVRYHCLYVDEVMGCLKGETNIVILDSCRNNPFAKSTHRGAGQRGLAAVSVRPRNSIIVYAASAGKEARDGVFTPILTKWITEKEPIERILKKVRKEVLERTDGEQNTAEYSQLIKDIYLAGLDKNAPVEKAAPAAYSPPVSARKESPSGSGDRTYSINGVSFTMKPIAAVKNAVLGDSGQSNNEEHTVSLSAYYIAETEVTQGLWEAVMGSNPSCFTSSPKNPVEQVSWLDCIDFCNELTAEVMGEEHCVYIIRGASITADFSKKGFRLPTEAEWEYAAMGGRGHKYSGCSGEGVLGNYAWYDANSGDKTHEVGKKKPNKYGLYDMSGNVWEWCWDWYGGSTPSGGQDPTGAASGSFRVLRGGCYYNASYCERSYRHYYSPVYSRYSLGLRLACRP